MSLLPIVLLPLLGSLIAGLLPHNARNREAWLAGGITVIGLVLTIVAYPQVAAGDPLRIEYAWLPQLGLNFVLRMDGFAWLFTLLILVVGLMVIFYARYYMSPEDPVPRFFSFFLAFMGAMLGLVLSGNLIQMVLFWEMTSLVSFMLIGYWHHNAEARRGARMALIVTGTGGLALLAGVLLLGQVAGSYDLDVVLAAGDVVRAHAWYPAILILVLLGAFTKSAQFPFHFWLPRAMAAPTPVSAYLHSATMVKAGVFLLVRFWPVLAGTDTWFWIVGTAGLVTLLLGAYAAMFQQDLKGLLAYSTISHLGLITLLLGLNSPLAAVAAIFHILNHATFKASLFMAAGIIDHETGTRDIRKLSGLYKAMPITATLAMVASASMAGVPLLNGFLSKEMFFTETVLISGDAFMRVGLPLAATVAGMFSVAYSLRFIKDVFFGPVAKDLPLAPHEPPRWMRFPIELLVLACLVVGVIPALTVGGILHVAAESVLGAQTPEYTLAVWHGFNLPLVMSIVALVGGVLVYFLLHRFLRMGTLDRVPLISGLDGRSTFEATLNLIGSLADRAERFFGTQRLQPQLFIMVLLALMAGAAPLMMNGVTWGDKMLTPVDTSFVVLWIIGITCAFAAAWQAKYHRLAALMLMGGSGLVTCITFVWFSAPDLALTQLMVEVVTMILILLGLRWLPALPRADAALPGAKRTSRRVRDIVIATLGGTAMTVAAFAILTRGFPQSISPYFLDRAAPEGGGTNVVNVILVDFRGFDTMGELTVVGIVALIVYALLRRFRPAPESLELPRQQRGPRASDVPPTHGAEDQAARGYLHVPGVLMRMLLPILGMVGIYFLMRGHNLPGGGFVAGLVTAVAIILQYIVGGTLWVEKHMKMRPQKWMGWGLLFAVGTGLGSLLFGYPFLTSHSPYVDVPLIGSVHVASALFFDLGVYALVVGSTVLILTAIAHQSVRSHRAAEKPVAEGGQ